MRGADKTMVKVDDLIWVKGNNENKYVYKDQEYNSVGRECPEIISNETRIRNTYFDKDVVKRLNFSNQFDSPFILSDSETSNAKIIGYISNIHLVFNAIRQVNSDIKRERAKSESLKQELERLQSDVKKYEFIDVYEATVNVCKIILEQIKMLNKSIEKLNDTKSKLYIIDERIKYVNEKLILYNDIDYNVVDKLEDDLKNYSDLISFRTKLKGIDDNIVNSKGQLDLENERITNEEKCLNDLIQSVKVCPLSNGEFFDSCKELIKNA